MEQVGLKLVLEASTGTSVKQIQTVVTALEDMPVAANTAAKGVDKFTSAITKAEKPVFDLDKAVKEATDRINVSIDKMVSDAIGGTTKLEASIGPVSTAFNKLKASAGGAANVFNGATLGAAKFIPPLEKIPPAAIKAGEALSKTGKASGSATLALSNLGRVAQDAPFGFIGIQNNLNPLLESFQRLKAESGSSKLALKALGSSLIGAGGIGLALSAVTAAVTFAQMGFRAWGGSAKESAAKVKDALTDISNSTAQDLVKLQTYVSFATDVNKSLDERKKAVNALQKEYPQYLKNISDEAILTGQATDAINKSIDAILRKATLSLLKDEIAAVVAESAKAILQVQKGVIATKQAADAERVRAESLKGQTKEFDKQAAAALQSGRALGEVNPQLQKFTNLSQQAVANKPEDRIKRIKEELIKLVQPLVDATINFEDIGTSAETAEKKGKTFSDFVSKLKIDLEGLKDVQAKDPFSDITKATEKLKFQFQELKKDGKLTAQDIIDGPGIIDAINKVQSELLNVKLFKAEQATAASQSAENWALVYKNALAKATGNIVPPVPDLTKEDAIKGLKPGLDAIEAAYKKTFGVTLAEVRKLTTEMGDVIEGLAESAVASIADGIGKALVGGGNPFSGILLILGDGLQSLGKMVIATFLTMEALKKVLNSVGITNPIAGVAIGAAMVALGAVIKSKVEQTKFAAGGIVTGPTNALIGEAGPEVVFPLNKLDSFLSDRNGGSQPIVMETVVRGSDILLVQQRAGASFKRTNG